MKSIFKTSVICLLALVLNGCATGPKYTEVKDSLPNLSPENGRIYFYRPGKVFGAAIQPDIKLNGIVVGESKPGGFFFVDVPPASYEVILSTETDKKLTFVLEKREEKCIRLSVGLGIVAFRVYPELAEASVCNTEIQDMSFTGVAKK